VGGRGPARRLRHSASPACATTPGAPGAAEVLVRAPSRRGSGASPVTAGRTRGIGPIRHPPVSTELVPRPRRHHRERLPRAPRPGREGEPCRAVLPQPGADAAPVRALPRCGSARLALSWLSPTAGWLGDPRRAMTGLFLSIARVLPDAYPLNGQLDTYVAADPSRTNPSPRAAARLDGCAGRVLGHTVTWLMRRGCAALLACPGRPHLADERLPHAQRQGLLHAPRRGGARTAA